MDKEKIEKLPDIEVVEVYPDPAAPKSGTKEKGTVHISIKELGIDIKNILYIINNKGVIRISRPTKLYKEPQELEPKDKP